MARTRNLILALALAAVPVCLNAADWPQWLGPDRTGAAPAVASVEGAEGVEFELIWKRDLGSGYSSLAVRSGSIVTMAAEGDNDYVLALDRESGEELWRYRLGESFLGRDGSDDGPASTPTIGGETVFAIEPSGRLVALDLQDGSLRWEKHLERDFGAESHTYGYSTAPVWTPLALIVSAGGGATGSMLVALDPKSGETRWSAGEETVRHQTPAIATLGETEQVIAPHNSGVQGFAIESGEKLWSLDFEDRSGSGQAIVLDDGRILVPRWPGTALIQVSRNSSGFEAELIWTTGNLSNSYAVPVRYRDHLYGFDGRFLTCIALETGEKVWKSREPSGQAVTLAGDKLWVVSSGGELVVAEATPDGYNELGRVSTFEARRVYTPPTISDSLVLVRNLTEAAAWRPRASGSGKSNTAPAPSGWIAELIESFKAAPDRQAAVTDFENRNPEWPVSKDGKVHFFYRGDEEDLAIVGDMTGGHLEVPMLKIEGTDLYYRTFEAPDVYRWEYNFRVFDENRTDPRNPIEVQSGDRSRSAVASSSNLHSVTPPGEARGSKGRLERIEFSSPGSDDSLAASVYLPAGYSGESERRLPLALWFYGERALEQGMAQAHLDRLGLPVVVAFLKLPPNYAWGGGRAKFATALSEVVLPHLESRFRAGGDPSKRLMVAQGDATAAVLLWTFQAGEVGHLALQSISMGEFAIEREFEPLFDAPSMGVHLDWGESNEFNVDWGLDIDARSQELASALQRHGHSVSTATSPGGSNWTRWISHLPAILDTFEE